MGTTAGQGGVAVWRVIAEELRRDIVEERYPVGSKLPSEADLAVRFGVHRNTVRQSIASLVDDGLVESRRGSGTYVTAARLLMHRIGTRTRLTTSLTRGGGVVAGRLLASPWFGPAPEAVAKTLSLDGADGMLLKTLRLVDGIPVARATHWSAATLRDLVPELSRTGSMTAALRSVGIQDYVRVETVIGARIATADEAEDLQIGAGAVVLVSRSLDALPDGRPLQSSITRFPAERIEFGVDHQPPAEGALRVSTC